DASQSRARVRVRRRHRGLRAAGPSPEGRRPRRTTVTDGILIVDKPPGITSAEAVRRVKGRSRIKVGHLGTLDPFATGVLPLCIGEATKIAQFLNAADKRYEGVICLGRATDTGDHTGEETRSAPVPALDDQALRTAERRFTGRYVQTPPMYSA